MSHGIPSANRTSQPLLGRNTQTEKSVKESATKAYESLKNWLNSEAAAKTEEAATNSCTRPKNPPIKTYNCHSPIKTYNCHSPIKAYAEPNAKPYAQKGNDSSAGISWWRL